MTLPEAVRWHRHTLHLLDQRLLPHTIAELHIDSLEAGIDAIRTLAVRGAPAIGIAAAYILALSMRDVPASLFAATLEANATRLQNARPTAVNLGWACARLLAVQDGGFEALVEEAERIHNEDRAQCSAIGEHGQVLMRPGIRVLTHCNAGALAVSHLGTATAPLYVAHQRGMPFRVYTNETRPLWQGARLTAWELAHAGIDVTLLCDNAAASLMARREVDIVIVGTDRVARNGDVANKIGTLMLAVLAQHYDVPFYVACPSSTFDPRTPDGAAIPIEMREDAEVTGTHAARVPAYNPAFDVTPAHLVTGILSERGLVMHPTERNLLQHFPAR